MIYLITECGTEAIKTKLIGHVYLGDRYYENTDENAVFPVDSEAELCSSLTKFNGNFGMIYNGTDKVYLVADRIMSKALFYTVKGGDVYVSESIVALTSYLKIDTLSADTLEEYRAAGFVLGDNTVYSGVKFVLAGTYVELDKNTTDIKVKRYFDYAHKDFYPTDDWEALAKQLDEVTDRAFARMINELNGRQAVLFLSGGYDSRLVAVMLDKYKYKNVVCVTFKTRHGKEELVAKEIADKLNFKIIFIDSVDIYKRITKSPEYKQYLLEASGGISFPYVQGCLLKELMDSGEIEKDCVVLTGNSGDVIEGNDIADELTGKDIYTKREIVDAILERHCFQYGRKQGHSAQIRSCVERDLPNQETFTYEEAQDWFETYNWQHRQTKYVVNDVRCYEHYLKVDWRLPLWDNEIVDFWLHMPIELREKRKFYYYYVRKEDYGTANTTSLYAKIRDAVRNTAHALLVPLYPFRKMYEYRKERNWRYYGVNFIGYVGVLCKTKGYKTTAITARIHQFYDEFYKPMRKE